ncbi:MAG: hypothetical protein RBR69_04960 [Candidatus Cloacimonadaceae bacterium]|nr:hypothetical protein [Candidatus Cloacimonadaceae bacterium]
MPTDDIILEVEAADGKGYDAWNKGQGLHQQNPELMNSVLNIKY